MLTKLREVLPPCLDPPCQLPGVPEVSQREVFVIQNCHLVVFLPDDIDDVAAPERDDALLLVDPAEAVDDALVLLVLRDELLRVLDLQQDLDALQRRHDRLGHGRGDAAGDEVEHEVVVHGDCGSLVTCGCFSSLKNAVVCNQQGVNERETWRQWQPESKDEYMLENGGIFGTN